MDKVPQTEYQCDGSTAPTRQRWFAAPTSIATRSVTALDTAAATHAPLANEWSRVESSELKTNGWTMKEWTSGVERSGVEWSGVEWSGVEWSKLDSEEEKTAKNPTR